MLEPGRVMDADVELLSESGRDAMVRKNDDLAVKAAEEQSDESGTWLSVLGRELELENWRAAVTRKREVSAVRSAHDGEDVHERRRRDLCGLE